MAKPTEKKVAELTSAFDLFSKSKDLVLKNINIFGVLYLLPFIYTLLSSVDRKTVDTSRDSSLLDGLSRAGALGLIGFGAAIAALTVVVNIIIQFMILVAELEVSGGKKPTFAGLWESTKKYGLRLIGLGFLVGLMILGGLILFIVPGLIMLRRYFLSPYYLIDKDLTVTEAMRRSAADSKPHSSAIWGVIGVSILLSFTGIIPLIGGVLSFVLVSLYSVAAALRYREIKRLS